MVSRDEPAIAASHVALLRGINVGGRHRLPMARVRELLDAAGLGPVRTYIQSGNLVLASSLDEAALAQRVEQLLGDDAGFAVPTIVLGAHHLRRVLRDNPFTPAAPKLEHVVLLPQELAAERLDRLLALRDELAGRGQLGQDDLAPGERCVYLNHPDGLSQSRLATRATALLADGTARNLATLQALEAMLG